MAPREFNELMSDLDHPMFVVTVAAGGERDGCLVGFATQCSIHPPRFLACLSVKNRTYRLARGASVLAVHVVGPEEKDLAWTLGHVIVHWTASSEEAAAHALTLARGVPVKERSRYETPWSSADRVEYLRERIEESRRMQLAMLDAWPDQPHLDVTYTAREGARPVNAVARFLGGLSHADAHRQQVTKVLRQAQAARSAAR